MQSHLTLINLSILVAMPICVFSMILRIKSDHSPKQHWQVVEVEVHCYVLFILASGFKIATSCSSRLPLPPFQFIKINLLTLGILKLPFQILQPAINYRIPRFLSTLVTYYVTRLNKLFSWTPTLLSTAQTLNKFHGRIRITRRM
jgi:hypothetical protein